MTFNIGSARQSTNYGNNSYPAQNAFKGKFTHTNAGKGQWWEVQFSRDYWVDRVRIQNRRDCCGNRLSGTKVFIDNQYCGAVPGGAKNGQWYDVKCSKSLYGKKVRIVTVQNTYLSIQGFEAYTGSSGSTVTTTGSTTTTPSGKSSKITLKNPSMNKPYSAGSYKADWALQGGSKTSIAARGVGNWWKAEFEGGARLVERVRVKNRHDCCGGRIAGTKVTISGQFCATLPSAGNGAWIDVKCAKPLRGTEI